MGWCFCYASPLSTTLPFLAFIGQHYYCASPSHSSGFLGSFTSSLPLLFQWPFVKLFGLLGPITTSLPLITFRAYWLLSQPVEFTNSFLRLPWLIYFFFTSYCSHGFTISLLGFPWPFIYSLPLIILIGLLTIILVISPYWACFNILFSHFLHIVGFLQPLRFLSKVGINNGKIDKITFCGAKLLNFCNHQCWCS